MKTHIGLDISTSCTGWSLITVDDNLRPLTVKLGYIPLSSLKDPYSKADAVQELATDTDLFDPEILKFTLLSLFSNFSDIVDILQPTKSRLTNIIGKYLLILMSIFYHQSK